MWIGTSGVTSTVGYLTRGTERGGNYAHEPDVQAYSTRKQFLRGQYMHLAALDAVTVCANEFVFVETANCLELA